MILLPNPRPAERIGDLSTRLRLANFKAFYNFNNPYTIEENANYAGENALNSIAYQEFALIRQTAPVPFVFDRPQTIDSLILGKCSADYMTVEMYNEANVLIADSASILWRIGMNGAGPTYVKTDQSEWLIFGTPTTGEYPGTTGGVPINAIPISRMLAPETEKLDFDDQQVVIFQFAPIDNVKKVILRFYNTNVVSTGLTVELHKVLFCLEDIFPEPKSFKYPLTLQSVSNFSIMNIAYGKEWPTARVLSMEWDRIDNIVRQRFENYVVAVQNFRPHFILPIGDCDYYLPPLFAVLASAELANDKQTNIWFWSGAKFGYRVAG